MVELAMETKEIAKRIRAGYVGKKKGGVDIGKLFLGCRLHLTHVLELNKVNLYVEPIGCCWLSVMTIKWLSRQDDPL